MYFLLYICVCVRGYSVRVKTGNLFLLYFNINYKDITSVEAKLNVFDNDIQIA